MRRSWRRDRRWRRSSNKPYTYLQLIYQCISKFPWQTTQVFGLVAVFPQVLVGHTARVFDVATGIYMKKVPAQSWHLSHRNLHKLYTFHRTPYTPHYLLLPSHTTLCCRLTHLAITSVPQHGQKQAVHILAAYSSLHVAQFPWQTTRLDDSGVWISGSISPGPSLAYSAGLRCRDRKLHERRFGRIETCV